MPGTYSQLLLHVVTSTKGRAPWIGSGCAALLCPYGAVRDTDLIHGFRFGRL